MQTLGKAETLYAWQLKRTACCKTSQVQCQKPTRQGGDKEQCLAFCIHSAWCQQADKGPLAGVPNSPCHSICLTGATAYSVFTHPG